MTIRRPGERRWGEIVLKTNEKGKREGAFLKTKGVNRVENVRIRDPDGRCDGALARLVVGRARIRVEGDHTRRGGKRGPICLLFSEAGRWYLYGAESNAREQVRYESSE